ncbi:hypothetical protein Pla123a_14480 [Posidoniimonas polymericola]|uniref:Uncharacterized protein n=1 Tax=Posidoniimonas polymericola TaxID=2528002 RepID=A0A5C5YRU1_9BACT|nr:hypothetical protein [Posidoniimonas polymericola]TWT77652.1 hypothetical protein Pla123a_14480 [Posidoniimonas polymericola]
MSLPMKIDSIRWHAGGVFVIGIAVTQTLYGWVGKGFFWMHVYPAMLFVSSFFFFWVGIRAWRYEED